MKLDTIDHPRYGLLHTVSDSKGITQIEATDSPEKALLRFYNRKGGEGYKTLEDALKYEGDTMVEPKSLACVTSVVSHM
jgi:hypothetical protein